MDEEERSDAREEEYVEDEYVSETEPTVPVQVILPVEDLPVISLPIEDKSVEVIPDNRS